MAGACASWADVAPGDNPFAAGFEAFDQAMHERNWPMPPCPAPRVIPVAGESIPASAHLREVKEGSKITGYYFRDSLDRGVILVAADMDPLHVQEIAAHERGHYWLRCINGDADGEHSSPSVWGEGGILERAEEILRLSPLPGLE